MAMTKAEKAAVEALKVTLALRWPTEAEPTHLFGFGDYDRPFGEPAAGTYYVVQGAGRVETVDLTPSGNWRVWLFNGTHNVCRGRYYATEREAHLSALWIACRAAAKHLRPSWAAFEDADAIASEARKEA